MFLTDDDYNAIITDDDLSIIDQSDTDTRQSVELIAIEEMSCYLRDTYDTEAIFSAEGDDRNKLIVMYCADITLYHLHSSIPGRLMPEIRQTRYDNALKWLDKVNAGKIEPDLPYIDDAAETPEDIFRTGNSNNLNAW